MTPWLNVKSLICLLFVINIISLVRSLPNIVLILTDDEDVVLSEDYIASYNMMPTRDKLFKTNGIEFNNAFSSTPTCCVSRSSILTGKYVHNHRVVNNTAYGNCWGHDWRANNEPFSYASYLNDIGYHTFFAGKYLNRYIDATSIPKGWDDWHALVGVIDYYNYHVSNNGFRVFYDDSDPNNYHTTVIKNLALEFLIDHNINMNYDSAPFLLVLSSVAAHSPFTVQNKYISEMHNSDILAPRTPNWNVIGMNDHHKVISSQLAMNKKQVEESDYIFRHRLYALKSVDDAIHDIYNYIAKEMDETVLDNTFFIYTSDHGFHSGQFGMAFAKMQLYETDIRIPFFISNSGENIAKGISVDIMANNIDIAPTILDLAGIDYKTETDMDGKSLLPFITVSDEFESDDDELQMFLVEYHGEGYNHIDFRMCGSHIDGFDTIKCDSWNNTFSCLRWINNRNDDDGIYCNFKCYTQGKIETECEPEYNNIELKGEYYDLNNDPWQMNNLWHTLSADQVKYFDDKILEFKACSGHECRELFNTNSMIASKKEIIHEENSFYDVSRLLAFLTY